MKLPVFNIHEVDARAGISITNYNLGLSWPEHPILICLNDYCNKCQVMRTAIMPVVPILMVVECNKQAWHFVWFENSDFSFSLDSLILAQITKYDSIQI